MVNDEDMKKAIDIEKQLRNRRQLKSASSPRPYFSNEEASKKYEEAAQKWRHYVDTLRPNDANYRMRDQYVENMLEDLKNAKKLAYEKQEKARIEVRIDELTSKFQQQSEKGKQMANSLESRAFAYLAILSFAGALLAISLKLTGSVVGPSSANNKWIGLCLFLIGCMFTFFYFRIKRK